MNQAVPLLVVAVPGSGLLLWQISGVISGSCCGRPISDVL